MKYRDAVAERMCQFTALYKASVHGALRLHKLYTLHSTSRFAMLLHKSSPSHCFTAPRAGIIDQPSIEPSRVRLPLSRVN